MGQKDIAEKLLVEHNDVFADIVNVLLFNGKQIVKENELEDTKDRTQYKIDGKLHEQERDISKLLKSKDVIISMVGIEHQTEIDRDAPLRVISYDGASYRRQLLGNQKERYPVITMVLYFGKNRWRTYKSLHDCVYVPKELSLYIQDYKINVFEIAHLTPEQVNMFQSDFKIVADYFVQTRMNKDYSPSKETIRHVDETFKLMSVLTGDQRFEDVQTFSDNRRCINMCEVLDRAENRGIEKGRVEGRAEGRVMAYKECGLSVQEIAKRVSLSVEKVMEILSDVSLQQ